MTEPLSNDAILKLLQEDADKPRRGGGKKTDITEERTLPVWFKLDHHLCTSVCDHRQQSPNSEKACWNPDCKDPRPSTDRGTNIVAEVKGQWVCRFCYLNGYLRGETNAA